MVLTSWLQIQNQALDRISGGVITAADLTAGLKPEAKRVNLFFDQALEEVLMDHDWACATKTLFLASLTTTETPTLPVGAVELSGGQLRKYYFPLPPYDPTGLAAGSVNFEILRVSAVSFTDDWAYERRKVFVKTAVSAVNTYVNVIFKLGFADAGLDTKFTSALKLKLAMLMAPPLTGKDNTRDMKLQMEYDSVIAAARLRDNTDGDQEPEGFWKDRAQLSIPKIWQDSTGAIHEEG